MSRSPATQRVPRRLRIGSKLPTSYEEPRTAILAAFRRQRHSQHYLGKFPLRDRSLLFRGQDLQAQTREDPRTLPAWHSMSADSAASAIRGVARSTTPPRARFGLDNAGHPIGHNVRAYGPR